MALVKALIYTLDFTRPSVDLTERLRSLFLQKDKVISMRTKIHSHRLDDLEFRVGVRCQAINSRDLHFHAGGRSLSFGKSRDGQHACQQ